MYAPVLPFLINSYTKNKIVETHDSMSYEAQLSSKLIAIFLIADGVAMILAPFLGGLFYDTLGYGGAFDVASLFALFVTILFFIFGGVLKCEKFHSKPQKIESA